MSLQFTAVYDIVKQIPRGKVATYGQIAILAGDPKGARTVGWALHGNPDEENIPCYRVVNRQGRVSDAFAFGGINRQIALLAADGIPCDENGCVDLKRFQWQPEGSVRTGTVGVLPDSAGASGSIPVCDEMFCSVGTEAEDVPPSWCRPMQEQEH